MAMPKWLKVLEQVAPLIIGFTPLAPLAPAVTAAISMAEQIPGATGEQKKAIVQEIVRVSAQGANAQANKVVLDPAAAVRASSDVIDSVVDIVNIAHQLPEAPAPTV
jgi:hypothetical protein